MSESANVSYSILHEPWWWDAAALAGWDQVEISVDGNTVARWPFTRRQPVTGLTMLGSPPLTNRAGPWIDAGNGKLCTRYARTGDLLTRLIAELPDSHWFTQSFHPDLEYWLPLHWAGFRLEPRVSYVIDDCRDNAAAQSALSETTRRQLRKSQRNLAIEEIGAGRLIDLVRKTFQRQGEGMRVSPEVLESLMAATAARGAGRAIAAVDGSGKTHAAAFFVWDAKRMYYLIGGGDPALRSSGAGTHVLWDGICDAGKRGIAFDFEGTMLPNIERFFRGFGARAMTYLTATKGSALVRAGWSVARALRK